MNEVIGVLKGAFLVNDETLNNFLSSKNVMKRGIFFLFACFLVASFPTFVGQLVDNVQVFTEERAADFEEEFISGFERVMSFMPQDEEFQEIFLEQFQTKFPLGVKYGRSNRYPAPPTPKTHWWFFPIDKQLAHRCFETSGILVGVWHLGFVICQTGREVVEILTTSLD